MTVRRPGPSRPPAWAERLIEIVLGNDPGSHFIVGDLREEFAARPSTVRYLIDGARVSVRMRWTRAREDRRRGQRHVEAGGNRGDRRMSLLSHNLRIAVRSLAKRPVSSGAMILTLGVAIGATSTIVSAVDGVILDPLPFDDPSRLVVMEVNTGGAGWYGTSAPEFFDAQRDLNSIGELGGFVTGQLTLGDSVAPRRIQVAFMTADVFSVLGVEAREGRYYTASEDVPQAAPVVVLSAAFRREVPSATVLLSGTEYEVLGTMPDRFRFPDASIDAWIPLALDRTEPAPRANHFLTLVGRLAPEVPLAGARAELERFAATTRITYPDNYSARGFEARLLPLHEWVVGPTRLPLLILFVTAGIVLLVASANSALLLLARSEARRSEMAVRAAIGATRGRLIAQLLTEMLVVAGLGGALGLLLAFGGIGALVRLAPVGTPRLENVGLDVTVVVWTIAATLFTGLLVGIVPAVRGGHDGTRGAIRGDRTGGGSPRSVRTRRVLLATQMALAAILTLGAGLMFRTLSNLDRTELGFEPSGVLTMALNPSSTRYASDEQRVRLYEGLIEGVAALPGVEAAAASCTLPMTAYCGFLSLILEGQEGVPIGEAHDAVRQIVTAGYVETLGLAVLRGRGLNASDDADGALVALVNETMAAQLWPGEEPVGQRFRMFTEGQPFMEVVGVVRDVRNTGPDRPSDPLFYAPLAQAGISAYATPTAMSLAVRTAGSPSSFVGPVRQAVRDIDPTIPISRVQSLDDIVGSTLALRRFTLRLLQTFSLAAVLLAVVGVYGVMSVTVGERRAELAIRKALGAEEIRLVRRMMVEGITMALFGIAVGLAGGVFLARWMAGLLYGVTTLDLPTLTAVFVLLTTLAAASAALPALRASRIQPMTTLRREG